MICIFSMLADVWKNPDSIHTEPELNGRVLAVAQDIVYCVQIQGAKLQSTSV